MRKTIEASALEMTQKGDLEGVLAGWFNRRVSQVFEFHGAALARHFIARSSGGSRSENVEALFSSCGKNKLGGGIR